MKKSGLLICVLILLQATGCINPQAGVSVSSCRYAKLFELVELQSGTSVVTISPYDGRTDTLSVSQPLDNIICMSTSHVACLSEIGADSVITAVSGIQYIADPALQHRFAESTLYDIGYEASLDYERIMSLNPDLILAYTVSSSEPPYLSKLRSLGLTVLVLHDHLENHPLARAEYIRLFGALTGRNEVADSIFNVVAERYEALKKSKNATNKKKVLMNIPYADVWYVPGYDSYMSRLIRDAGGDVLGAAKGTSVSRVISMEEAWAFSKEADIWLNPGHCTSREELASIHRLFSSFGPMSDCRPIYNNTLRTAPKGGNDFYESGVVRPDLVLEDLIYIMSQSSSPDSAMSGTQNEVEEPLNYFMPLL